MLDSSLPIGCAACYGKDSNCSCKKIGRLNNATPEEWDATRPRTINELGWDESRIDVIGQNGGDGLHYKTVAADKPANKYKVKLKGVEFDVYDILYAFHVFNPAVQHAIKKLLKAGDRGFKGREQDLREAIQSIERAVELENESND